MINDIDRPLSVIVEGEAVLVEGRGIAITLTAIAAADLSDALLGAACEARGRALRPATSTEVAADSGR